MFLAAALLAASFPQAMPAVASDSPSAPNCRRRNRKKPTQQNRILLQDQLWPTATAPKVAADNAAVNGESSSFSRRDSTRGADSAGEIRRSPRFAESATKRLVKKCLDWMSVLGHGTAAFDAYSTRKAISGGYGTEAIADAPLRRTPTRFTPRRRSAPPVMDFLATK